jgi:hypothetical protein
VVSNYQLALVTKARVKRSSIFWQTIISMGSRGVLLILLAAHPDRTDFGILRKPLRKLRSPKYDNLTQILGKLALMNTKLP